LRDYDFRRGNRLADMPLGVIGQVHQQPSNRGWELFPADFPLFIELCRRECADATRAFAEAHYEFGQQLISRCARSQLTFHRRHLFRAKLSAFSVGE
jgi:hypothetical protein